MNCEGLRLPVVEDEDLRERAALPLPVAGTKIWLWLDYYERIFAIYVQDFVLDWHDLSHKILIRWD